MTGKKRREAKKKGYVNVPQPVIRWFVFFFVPFFSVG